MPAPNFETYVRLPVKKKALIWGGIAAVFLVLFFFVSFKPLNDQRSRLKAESAKLGEQIMDKQAIAENLPAVKKAVEEMDSRLTNALKRLPTSKEIASLLKNVGDLATDSGLDSTLFQPDKEKPIAPDYFYSEIPLKMEERGGFYELGRFFDRVSRLPRIVTINDINITTKYDEKNEPIITAQFIATTYKFLLPEERPKEDPKKKTTGKPDAKKQEGK